MLAIPIYNMYIGEKEEDPSDIGYPMPGNGITGTRPYGVWMILGEIVYLRPLRDGFMA